ncbi:hypothetical protein SNE40_017177 [Patella caerulea]|uniref:Uncharacterized protein n=1 Tax=Patella caerulea TaxID=87958 RepID=A0AAN8J9Y5_PATCE
MDINNKPTTSVQQFNNTTRPHERQQHQSNKLTTPNHKRQIISTRPTSQQDQANTPPTPGQHVNYIRPYEHQ